MIEARSSARPAWLGGGAIFLAVLTLVGAVWTFRPTSDEPPLPPMAVTSDLSRFRADAWFLPAEELLGFVEIPAGPFLMGSDPGLDPLAFDNEHWLDTGGRATVELPTLYVGRYEVTVAQFRAFVEAALARGAAAGVSGNARRVGPSPRGRLAGHPSHRGRMGEGGSGHRRTDLHLGR